MIDPVTSKEETLSPSEIVHETAYLGSMKNARDVLVAGIGTFTSHMAPMKVSTPTRERRGAVERHLLRSWNVQQ